MSNKSVPLISPEMLQAFISRLRLVNNNQLYTRTILQQAMAGTDSTGIIDPPGRNMSVECGWISGQPAAEVYQQLYDRNGIARRVVTVYPDECWQSLPFVYDGKTEDEDTEFKQSWNDLDNRLHLNHYLQRVDVLSGIGHYGIMLLGFDDISDGNNLSTPVQGIDEKGMKVKGATPPNLLYLRVFPEYQARIASIVTNPGNPRYGHPLTYSVTFANPLLGEVYNTTNLIVHWSRVIHFADNRQSSDVIGDPRLKPVLDYVTDLRKIGGASAEGYWKGAVPGLAFETMPELLGEAAMDEDTIKVQMQEFQDGLKRYLALDGVTAKPLLPQALDPTPFAMLQLQKISATTGIPLRILMGSEAGHLASTQDGITLRARVNARLKRYIDPMIIRPTVDRFRVFNILPEPLNAKYSVGWRCPATNDKDQSLVSLQKAQTLMQYVSGRCFTVIGPREFLIHVMNFTESESNYILEQVKKDPDGFQAKMQKMFDKNTDANPQGGGRLGNAGKSSGRPSGNIQEG